MLQLLCTYTAVELQSRLVAGGWRRHHQEQGERDVDELNQEENYIARLLYVCHVKQGFLSTC